MSLKSILTCLAVLLAAFATPVLAQSTQNAPSQEEFTLNYAAVQDATPQRLRQVLRRTLQAEPMSRATPREDRIYENPATRLSGAAYEPRYNCEHGENSVSCWCNWNEDANDCKNMILANPCGENGSWWTSNVDGEYGCDG